MEEYNNRYVKKGRRSILNEPYDLGRIERLKSIITDFNDQGNRKFYAIHIDGEMVVSRNADAQQFDNYKRHMTPTTKRIEIRMFFGDSPNCNAHIFHTNAQELNGAPQKDVEQRISEALEKQRMETLITSLKTEVKRKTKKLKQYKAIQAELDEKQIDLKGLISKGMELYGQYSANKGGASSPTPVQGTPETEVEIEVQEESKADRQYARMKKELSEKELIKALRTWEVFTAYPDLQSQFTELIKQKIGNHGKI